MNTDIENVEAIVIGAGVVGLAIARQLALDGKEVIVLEAAPSIGTETSSRNSEVIHAGIYYPTGSLMARFCVEGRRQLYAYCEERGVEYRRCGKLIVATDTSEVEKLSAIEAQAKANGVEDIHFLTAAEAQKLEPALSCQAALISPSTGILDSHGYMLALQGDAENAGATFAFNAAATSGEVTTDGIVVEADGLRLRCRYLINSAGLHAPAVARRILGQPQEKIPGSYYAKGEYFLLAGRSPFSHLIYPVPQPGGLGVHLTLDLANSARFGPNVQWVDTIDYTTDITRSYLFYDAVRRYWPDLQDDALLPGYAGIRPKIVPPDLAKQDFLIMGPADHGIRGLVNLFGIESPGLTSSLAIADYVADLLRGEA
jgi:L-2-hydroxyglutarate oxidase LhgO